MTQARAERIMPVRDVPIDVHEARLQDVPHNSLPPHQVSEGAHHLAVLKHAIGGVAAIVVAAVIGISALVFFGESMTGAFSQFAAYYATVHTNLAAAHGNTPVLIIDGLLNLFIILFSSLFLYACVRS